MNRNNLLKTKADLKVVELGPKTLTHVNVGRRKGAWQVNLVHWMPFITTHFKYRSSS